MKKIGEETAPKNGQGVMEEEEKIKYVNTT
jgi:hypothetical protein